MVTTTHRTVCVVGAGPRGLSVLERLCANARSLPEGSTVHVHVVDPYPPGSGKVWRTDQSRHLLMNTVAGQISVFTDASVDLQGPLEPGPSLHEWAVALAADTSGRGHPAGVLEEARRLGPDTYPTRAFYGHYLQWAYRRVLDGAPAGLTVTAHPHLAVTLDDAPGAQDGSRQQVVLDDGTVLGGLDMVVLCQGHLPARPDTAEQEFASRVRRSGLVRIAPANPADVDLGVLAPGTKVLLRGLGLNFFDYLAQLTAGRGGTFSRTRGWLVYHPCGQEPQIYAGSRRGIPYQARGENEKGPHGRHEPRLFSAERVAELRRAHGDYGVDFREHLWPLIAREVEAVYYSTLFMSRGNTAGAEQLYADYLQAGPGEQTLAVLEAYGIGEKYRWDWELLERPYRHRQFSSPRDFTDWLLDHLREDLAEARSGNVSGPLKAALDVLRDLRNEVRLAVDHGGLHGDSYRTDLDGWYTPLNAFLSIGPPARRVEEMAALIEAGVLQVIGPDLRVRAGRTGYTAGSPLVPGSSVRVDALVEARLPTITLSRTGDPLLRHLLESGQCAGYRIPTRSGGSYLTEGLAVTGRPFHLIDAAGRPHPRRLAFGVPTESVHWVTAAGIRPGVNSVTLTDSDAIARAALGCGPAVPEGSGTAATATGGAHAATKPAQDEDSPMPTDTTPTVDAEADEGLAAVHLDSGLLSPVWTGTRVAAAVSDGAWLQAMLDAEAALSRAQARLGTVPQAAAQVITRAARAERLDLTAVARQSRESANPVVALVREFTAVVAAQDPEAAAYVHRGSTSQDILDTATVLVADRALRLIRTDLAQVEEALAALAAEHRDTLMAGRTLALHAVPTTFGLKAAGWRHLVLDAAQRLDGLTAAGLPVQLGGAAGTLAGYLEYAQKADPADYVQQLTEAFADELGLSAPLMPWHVLRTPVVDLATAAAFLCGALGKIAVDVLSLTRTEVGEVHEPAPSGRGASSAMPHKRNPVLATAIRSAALQAPQLAATVLGCMPSEDERSAGAWHAEWEPLRALLRLAGGAAHQAVELVSRLSVDPQRMRDNAGITGGQIVSERIAVVLAPALGKAQARQLLNEASATSARTGEPLADVLRQDGPAAAVLADPGLGALFSAEAYTGAAGPLTDRALSRSLPSRSPRQGRS